MFCSKCGAKAPDGSSFCGQCGNRLVAPPPAPVAQSQTYAQPGVTGNAISVNNTADRRLIRVYVVPENVRKQYCKYLSLELYTDRLVGKGGPNGDITYFFKNYMGVTWTPASVATQFAQIVFLTHENASRFVGGGNLTNLVDMNKIPFCSVMFSYAEANNYTKALYMDIKAALDAFIEQQSQNPAGGVVVQNTISPAEELKKFKELLDMGIITQEEFDRKKQQIMGF